MLRGRRSPERTIYAERIHHAEFVGTDPGARKVYVPMAQASLVDFGARYVVYSQSIALEGDLGDRHISIIEFKRRRVSSRLVRFCPNSGDQGNPARRGAPHGRPVPWG